VLEPVALCRLHPARDREGWVHRAAELGFPSLGPLCQQVQRGHPLRLAYSGDRIGLAECLTGMLPREVIVRTSFSTSLVPSSDRPFVLTLVSEASTIPEKYPGRLRADGFAD
jgi:hypothetical protein